MRSLTSAFENATVAEHYREVLFAYMDFSGGALYVCNAGYTIPMSSQQWLGIGNFGSVEPVTESIDGSATALKFQLSGVNPAHIAITLGEQYQGRTCSMWAALLDAEYKIISEPDLVWKGRMDTMDITVGETATIALTVEHFLADRDRPRTRRYNHADHTSRVDSLDTFFEFMETMVDKEFQWGPK